MSIEKIASVIESKAGMLTKASDNIWEYAEMAFREHKSMEELCGILEAEGFEVKKGIGDVETAFSGSFGSGKPVIGILGEFDALDNLNQVAGATHKECFIEGAPGHGCGHNLFGVGSLAAAIAVKEYLKETGASGTVVYFGTPGEEGGSGKAFMAREGCFDQLDAAITWHPGSVNVASNNSSLANIQVKFKYYGISAHAAGDPHNGRSALDAVELLNIGVQFLREHMIPEARIHYAITNAGGFSPNVVQPYAEVLYLIRAPKNALAKDLYDRVMKIAKGAELMTETRMEYEFIKACSNVVNNVVLESQLDKNLHNVPLPEYTEEEMALAAEYKESSKQFAVDLAEKHMAGGPEVVKYIKEHVGGPLNNFIMPYYPSGKAMGGSTDVGDVSWVCPTAQISAVTLAADTPGHSWQIVSQGKSSIAHKGMLYAGKVMAATVIDLMKDPELLAAAKAEHAERVGPDGYICPIPKGVKPQPIK
ncbi:MAG: amidohydrolase [Clostridia bacterium]|nr:amidohydrolase [Clostridia bacterium]MBR5283861.1 amidohydrolase [Clostridia bacterium]